MERYFSHNPFASPEHTHTTRAEVSCLKVVNYTVMMENLRLPLLSLDIDRTIGSFFDLEFAEENNESLMRIVFRHQVQRIYMYMREDSAYSHCYEDKIELFLTYAFSSNETTALFRLNEGFGRLDMRKDMSKCFDEISRITCKVAHPLTLPYIMIRSVRLRLNQRHLDAASMAEQMELILACNTREVKHGVRRIFTNRPNSWNFRRIGRYWPDNRRSMISILSSAAALCKAIDELREAMASFWSRLSDKEKSSEMTAIHTRLARGLKEERAQLDSIVGFTRQLEQRMHALESSIHIMALEHSQRNGQLNMATAQWQIDLSTTTTRDSKTMKGLAFMGALFLPGTFMSAIFSMPFFEFKIDKLWVYFAATVPLTTLTIAVWVMYEISQQRNARAKRIVMKKVIAELQDNVEEALRTDTNETTHFSIYLHEQGFSNVRVRC
ncbi:uncharacterized protein B0T23DRAFT_405395 [Neurospora hispaniola]|uniref:Mg2+ transporter protein, CorA-like/Zinc transport protein ZntB n=1 Tax=Neurospora hispaniola TaxID=588809 RepID=A0AAJ0I5C4_9PEZI|nr:hypothetical protein B0T23DRAFT_405395 [Neurospora hispaniola]